MQQSSQRIERVTGMVKDREDFEIRSRRLAEELEEYERAISVGSASRAEHRLSECQVGYAVESEFMKSVQNACEIIFSHFCEHQYLSYEKNLV